MTVSVTVTEDLAPTFVLNCLSAGVASIVDKKLAMQHEKNGDFGHDWLKTHSAGSGPYSLKAWKANESVAMDAFPGARHTAVQMKRVIIRHVPEASAQRLQLEKGDIDVARNLTPDQLKAWKAVVAPLQKQWAEAVTKAGGNPDEIYKELQDSIAKNGAGM